MHRNRDWWPASDVRGAGPSQGTYPSPVILCWIRCLVGPYRALAEKPDTMKPDREEAKACIPAMEIAQYPPPSRMNGIYIDRWPFTCRKKNCGPRRNPLVGVNPSFVKLYLFAVLSTAPECALDLAAVSSSFLRERSPILQFPEV